jgi:SWI/SNF-related matrix-associated actin-dependent regulator of chromatin subfamily B member 1
MVNSQQHPGHQMTQLMMQQRRLQGLQQGHPHASPHQAPINLAMQHQMTMQQRLQHQQFMMRQQQMRAQQIQVQQAQQAQQMQQQAQAHHLHAASQAQMTTGMTAHLQGQSPFAGPGTGGFQPPARPGSVAQGLGLPQQQIPQQQMPQQQQMPPQISQQHLPQQVMQLSDAQRAQAQVFQHVVRTRYAQLRAMAMQKGEQITEELNHRLMVQARAQAPIIIQRSRQQQIQQQQQQQQQMMISQLHGPAGDG